MSKLQEIRADYDKQTITVYQAYGKNIALPAIQHNRFQSPFSFKRMTWIKPSYLWLMGRSNWGTKSNQDYILAIKIKRDCWEKALGLGILTHPDKLIYQSGLMWQRAFDAATVHIQWDPERSIRGAKLEMRSIQVGISRHLIEEYNEDWIVEISDYTPLTKKINRLRKLGKHAEAKRLLPKERVYVVNVGLQKRIGVR